MKPEFWVVVAYEDGAPDGRGSEERIGCATYREALALMRQVDRTVDHFGRVDEMPERPYASGVESVELVDADGRRLWTSDYFLGAMHLQPVEQWQTGRVWWTDDEVYEPLPGVPRLLQGAAGA